MARSNSLLRIPDSLRDDVEQIFKLTDRFCAEHLDLEYDELVRKVVAKLARKRPSAKLIRDALRIGQVDPEPLSLRRVRSSRRTQAGPGFGPPTIAGIDVEAVTS